MSDLVMIPLRLTRDHIRRLDSAARYCGQTRQTFLQQVVMAEVVEVEEKKRFKKIHASRPSEVLVTRGSDEEPVREESVAVEQKGFDLSSALAPERPEPVSAPPVPQGVTVHMGDGSERRVVEQLAAYVAQGGEFERDRRLENAREIILASPSSEGEKRATLALLEESIRRKVESTSFGKAVKLTFDKISSLLKL